MLCRNPFIRDKDGKAFRRLGSTLADKLKAVPFPCGQCLPCRINRRRKWTTRLLIEHMHSSGGAFVTLTYRESDLPLVLPTGSSTLYKRDLQLFFKRFRKRASALGYKIRFYACGEYGSKSGRPHYHAIIFGMSDLHLVETISRLSWNYGFIYVGDCSEQSIAYVAGYVTKKMTSVRKGQQFDDNDKLREFTVCSRRPGIGRQLVLDIYAKYKGDPKFREYIDTKGITDLTEVRIGSKRYPLDRFLRSALFDLFNVDTEDATERFVLGVQRSFHDWVRAGQPFEFYSDFLVESDKAKADQLCRRFQIFHPRGDP